MKKNKVIKREPLYYIWGVLPKNKQEAKRIEMIGGIVLGCGMICFFGLISLISYIYIN